VAESNGVGPPGSADKKLGDIVGEVSSKASLLVREEIELAKAEVSTKVARLGRGAAVGVAAGFFAFLGVIFLLHTMAWGLNDLGLSIWAGYGVVTLLLFILAVVAGLLAYRFVKKGAPPTPDLAIEEAKKTRAALEEVRS
jgi:uncharacterized membrane protein YqjE